MKRSLEHLSPHKRDVLARIAARICAVPSVDVIVLFGSHARGDHVDDPANGYMSDFDILVVSPLDEDSEPWSACRDHIRTMGDVLVDIIVHTAEDIRHRVAQGDPFFRDVLTDGIALYDPGRVVLPRITALTTMQRVALAHVACPGYFERAAELERYADEDREERHRIAAFYLHAMAEIVYKAVLLAFTGYRPKTHDLARLARMCARAAPSLGPLVPAGIPDRGRLARLLRGGYVDARYDPAYTITRADLDALIRCVCSFRDRAEHACSAQLDTLIARLPRRE